jgi:tol-pal system protein YbgF
MIASAHAALFEDTDARKQILSMSEQLKASQKALLDLSSTTDQLKQQNQELRGKLEELEKNNEELSNSLKSYYNDLNERLKKFEPQDIEVEGVRGSAQPGEKDAYDRALKDFQNGDLAKANKSLNDFVNKYPSSPYWPLAKYWLANTQYAQKDYKAGIVSAQSIIKRFPEHPRVPEAMLTIANCQIESGQKSEAKKTLAEIVKKYPDSKAASTATSSLSSLK